MSEGHDAATDALSEKEKETLRLMARGHDAKSAASELGLSVHTINERLRNARRKLDVTSSREAARLLLESETIPTWGGPQNLGYTSLGDASEADGIQSPLHQAAGRSGMLWIGGIAMISAVALALGVALATPAADTPEFAGTDSAAMSLAVDETIDAREAVARDWLALVDAQDWRGSYTAASEALTDAISAEQWSEAKIAAHSELGAVVNRELYQFGSVKAPPADYRLVIFRTDYENRTGVEETITLVEEDGVYKVSGYLIEDPSSAEDNARTAAALKWLALGDAGEWRASWEATSNTFQAALPFASFEGAMQGARTPLGDVKDRKLATINIIEDNAKTFHIVRFRTDFTNQSSRIERVTLERQEGEYKVSGYFFE